MMQDGVYDHSKPRDIVDNGPAIRYDYMGPFEDAQDQLISRAIMSVTLPAAMIQDIVRPNLPQVQLFRPKYGYRTEEISIVDIVDVNLEYPPTRTDYSQSPTSYQGTARNVSESVW